MCFDVINFDLGFLEKIGKGESIRPLGEYNSGLIFFPANSRNQQLEVLFRATEKDGVGEKYDLLRLGHQPFPSHSQRWRSTGPHFAKLSAQAN